jgi:hypothetical protein
VKIKKQRTKGKRKKKKKKKKASFTTRGFEAQSIQRDQKREKAQLDRVNLKATTQEHIKKHEELKRQQLRWRDENCLEREARSQRARSTRKRVRGTRWRVAVWGERLKGAPGS